MHSNIHYSVGSEKGINICSKTTSLLSAIMRIRKMPNAKVEIFNSDTLFFQNFEEAFIYLLHLPDDKIFYYCRQVFDWDENGEHFIPQQIMQPIRCKKEEICEHMLDYAEYETFYLKRGKNEHPYEIHCESNNNNKKGIICFYMK